VEEGDIIGAIGNYLSSNFVASSKVEYLIEHLDGVLENIHSVVVEDICKKFTPRNMASMFIESSMTHKALQCLKHIDNHGLFKGVNATSICEEMKIWSNEADKLNMGWERTDGFTFGVRSKR
jgi:hypothetical protein